MPPKNNPRLPEDTWTVNTEERAEIQALGRKLNQWLMAQFSDRDSVHTKLVAGAFQYVMQLQKERATVIGDDFIIAHKAIEEFGIADRVEEPFAPAPEPTEIEEATPAPSEVGGPEAPVGPEVPAAPEAPAPAPVEEAAPEAAPETGPEGA